MAADITTPIYGASINKFVAAVGVMKALQLNPDIDLDDTISDFLPGVWGAAAPMSSFIQSVTIRELLTHTSGIPGPTANTFDSDYDTLKGIAQNSLGQVPATGTVYSNANYGFLRIFISSINGASYPPTFTDEQLEGVIINNYRIFMENEVFTLAGEDGEEITPTVTESAARYYQWNNGLAPWTIGDRSANLGSGATTFPCATLRSCWPG